MSPVTSRHRPAGVSLMVEAAGSSGLKANATFVRKGAITSDRSSYGPGTTARFMASGFNPNELVTFQFNGGGSNEPPVTALSNENGQVAADLSLPMQAAGAGFWSVSAVSPASGVVASLTG